MCLAGDGGGNGRRRKRRGVALPGEGDTPGGTGLAGALWRNGLNQGLAVGERFGVAPPLAGKGAAAPAKSSPPLAAGR